MGYFVTFVVGAWFGLMIAAVLCANDRGSSKSKKKEQA